MELLLLSNSTLPGKAWLEHALPLIANQLNGRRSAVFIPFAGVTQTWDEYTDKTAEVLAPLGINVTGIHRVADPLAAIEKAEIIIVGGGNTFQLLKESRERAAGADGGQGKTRRAVYRLERRRQPCLPDYPHDQRYADRRSKRFRRAGSVPAAN